MSFGEHLEELRSCLIKALLWVVVGTCVGLFFGEYVVNLIKLPLQDSLGEYYIENALLKFEEFSKSQQERNQPVHYDESQIASLVEDGYIFEVITIYPPAVLGNLQAQYPDTFPPPATSGESPRQPSGEAADGQAKPKLTGVDLVPLFTWRRVEDDPRVAIKSLASQEAFMIWLKAGVVAGIILTSPMIFYHMWSFIAAGLYPHEKRYVNIFLPFSVVLFLTGAAFCFFVVLPYVLNFLFSYNRSLGIDPDPRINEWLSFALFLPVGFGLSFQLPLVMLFLHRVGIFSVEVYLQKWRIAVLVIAVISMVLTPADPMSMMMMAGPLIGLYFLGIAICRWMPSAKGPLDA